MGANDAAAGTRPIRELVCPDVEESLTRRTAGAERRRHLRYRRSLLGSLRMRGEIHPIACVDIGYGGMQVRTPWPLEVAIGERVVVCIHQGVQRYEDEFAVAGRELTPEATTAVHLRL